VRRIRNTSFRAACIDGNRIADIAKPKHGNHPNTGPAPWQMAARILSATFSGATAQREAAHNFRLVHDRRCHETSGSDRKTRSARGIDSDDGAA
jgi:hypothetical protein